MDSPPLPVPVGSPVWATRFLYKSEQYCQIHFCVIFRILLFNTGIVSPHFSLIISEYTMQCQMHGHTVISKRF